MDQQAQSAVEAFAEAFTDAWTARQVGQAMTCAEAEAVAGVIALVDPAGAASFLRGHANGEDRGDDQADAHYWLRADYNAAAQDADHRARPDDDPEPGDRCKDCGQPITWLGPSPTTDWEHTRASGADQ